MEKTHLTKYKNLYIFVIIIIMGILMFIPTYIYAKEINNIYLVDNVEYNDLLKDKEYTIKGVLMDKKTNKPFVLNGKEYRIEEKFKAKDNNGKHEVTFKLDRDALIELLKKEHEQIDVVVFEEVYNDGKLVAEHKDINSKDQTVSVKPNFSPHRPPLPNTSAYLYDKNIAFKELIYAYTIICVTCFTIFLTYRIVKRRLIKNENNKEDLKKDN